LAWPLVAALLLLPAVFVAWLQGQPWGSSPALAAQSAWALHPAQGWAGMPWWAPITAAWQHASPAHLRGNLAAAAILGLMGWLLRARGPDALAWLLAWPLLHLGLMLDARLTWYAGASGVLHAGVGVLIVTSWHTTSRTGAAMVLLLVLAKLCLDVLAGYPLGHRAGLGVSVAPLSHILGTLLGLFLAGFHRARFASGGSNQA
jgi:membrane associated rhomboid family serine protease